MSERLFTALTVVSALGTGLVGGVFFAFSNFVMAGLARVPAPSGIAAMNSINVTVINPLFMTALFGTGLLCLAVGVYALFNWSMDGALLLLGGAILYFVGNVVVTMLFNVPLNNALAAVDPASTEGAAVWSRYLSEWVTWNTVRTVTALAASAAFIAALL
ncbi:Uncharacterized membrane protein [Mesorhizobium albiziae]|uniref:Uncharacterized membrane protein n=1 Tax=Neomesorhizobium albiziae TaxID=335020 RepID=A0A1I3XHK4_9HYPH|nr:anthrone oxygenase family protein [Mesorhizobium albiziae]GLS30444.1 membrane protein [Mesorhizobium albiziae]SFK19023.1 Uncharacterized membrane protein [Mesorhizobium albiziae]